MVGNGIDEKGVAFGAGVAREWEEADGDVEAVGEGGDFHGRGR